MICLMALKPVFNLYYLAPQLVMTTSFSSMSLLISKSSLNRKFFSIDKFRILLIVFSTLILIFGYLLIKPTFIEPFPLLNQFPKNSLVWSDSIGSKLIYYHNINTAKLNFGTNKAQQEIVQYLADNGIRQFILDEGNQIINFKNISSGTLREGFTYDNLRLFEYIPD